MLQQIEPVLHSFMNPTGLIPLSKAVSGSISDVIWFNQAYLQKQLKSGLKLLLLVD